LQTNFLDSRAVSTTDFTQTLHDTDESLVTKRIDVPVAEPWQIDEDKKAMHIWNDVSCRNGLTLGSACILSHRLFGQNRRSGFTVAI